MKKSRLTESQIVSILKESGVTDIHVIRCREYLSSAGFYPHSCCYSALSGVCKAHRNKVCAYQQFLPSVLVVPVRTLPVSPVTSIVFNLPEGAIRDQQNNNANRLQINGPSCFPYIHIKSR